MSDYAFSIEEKPIPLQRAGISGKRVFTKPETRAWQNKVKHYARKSIGRSPPLEGAVSLSVTFLKAVPPSWPRSKREKAINGELWPTGRPDLSNLVKSIEDAMNGIIYLDDSQIVNLHVVKAYSQKHAVLVRCAAI